MQKIEATVQRLRANFGQGLTRSLAWRKTQLNALLDMLKTEEAALLAALKRDLGKGEYEAWSSEIGFVISEIHLVLKKIDKWASARSVATPMVAQPGKSYVLPEPLGTVLIIGAWNYPLHLTVGPLVAAMAAGNCAVLKPSELAPATSALLAKLVPKYLDVNAFSVVEGAVPETTELLQQKFDHIFYTGGEAVAKIVMRAASEHLTPVTLELGGKSPCIVDASANLSVAAARIAWSKWMNAGQTCVAPDYILVEESVRDDLMAALRNKLTEFYGANPKHSDDYGRIVNARHFDRLTSYLEGQQIVYGGEIDAQQRYLSPTLVLDPDLESPLMKNEIFGPILPIITVSNKLEAIDIIGAQPKPLAMYLYTQDRPFEKTVLASTSAGSVGINDGMMFMANPKLPFGGVGNSGIGRYHGQFGFDTFSHLKAVLKRTTLLEHRLRYPPFSRRKLSIIKKFL